MEPQVSVSISFLRDGKEVAKVGIGSFGKQPKDDLKKSIAALNPMARGCCVFLANGVHSWTDLVEEGTFGEYYVLTVPVPGWCEVKSYLLPGRHEPVPVIRCDGVDFPNNLRFLRSERPSLRFQVLSVEAKKNGDRVPYSYCLSCAAVDGPFLDAYTTPFRELSDTKPVMHKKWLLGYQNHNKEKLEFLNESLEKFPLFVELTLASQELVYQAVNPGWKKRAWYWTAEKDSVGNDALSTRFRYAWGRKEDRQNPPIENPLVAENDPVALPQNASVLAFASADSFGIAEAPFTPSVPAAPFGIDANVDAVAVSEQDMDTPDEVMIYTKSQGLKSARPGQGKWKRELVAQWGDPCQATGSAVAVEGAHIYPFAEEGDDHEYDVHNGFLLTASVHYAFDNGLITLEIRDNQYQISVREDLRRDPILGPLHGRILGGDRGQELYNFTSNYFAMARKKNRRQ